MIYFDLNFFLNFLLFISILPIYVLQIIRPEITTDTDAITMNLLILYTWIFIIQGWKLDPFMLFSQCILILAILTLEWENIRLRGFIITLKNIIKKK
uniref:Uncharacterized protein n=1 Tax=Nitzschia sp. NIES-3576 TaxID=2083273 RepID=A0A2Z5ZAG9_9STRA|nr:hypothetical protein ycf66 [Nitzschia sp. NIES-3576]